MTHAVVVSSSDTTYTATFKTEHQLTTSVSPSGAGTITAGGWLDAGSTVTVSATAAAGYRFAGFSGDVTTTSNPMTVTMNGPKSLVANFVPVIQPQGPLLVDGAPGTAVYGNSFTVGTTGGSGTGAVTFAATGACSNTGGGALITVTSGSGECEITAFKAGDVNYYEATSPLVLVAAMRAAQATLTVIAPDTLTYGTAAALSTSGGSGDGAVTFSAGASTGCSVAGSQLSVTNASGTCMVTATKQGDASYNGPLTSAAATVTLLKASQTISFAPLPNVRVSDSPLTMSATASSGLVVAFTTSTPTVCASGAANGATITLLVSGTCTVIAQQPGNNNYLAATDVPQSFTVGNAKLDQTISFGTLPDRTMTQSPFTVSATASSGLGVKFSATTSSVCSTGGPNGVNVSLLAPGACTIRADQQGNASYNPAPPVTQSFLVSKANQTISFGPLSDKRLADGRITVNATASSGLAVTFSTTTPAVCAASGRNGATIRLLAAGTCSVTAQQGGDARYNAAAPATRSFTVR
jgi:hypothetical protein